MTYLDVDGDAVTVKVSAGTLALTNFIFSVPDVLGQQQLRTIDFHNGGFDLADLTISVVKKPTGDGLANVGYINATGHRLGTVTVAGDLGAIDAGNGDGDSSSVKGLTVHSMGLFGTSTGAPDLESDLKGTLDSFTVATDVKDVFINVAASTDPSVHIGPVKIGGSLIGGLAANSGELFGYGGFGDVTIGGSVVGGAGDASGSLGANNGEIGKVMIGGSLIGGSGKGSGEISNLHRGIGAVTIKGNLHGDLGADSGKIEAKTNIASLTVGGSIVGGVGADNTFTDSDGVAHVGQVFAGGTIRNITVANDLHGGAGAFTGAIKAVGDLGAITIGGSLLDGLTGANGGVIFSDANVGLVKIAHDVAGNAVGGGRIHAGGNIDGVSIGGSLIGGANMGSGEIDAVGQLGPVTIAHDLLGGTGMNSGLLQTTAGGITSVSIGGSLVGGTGDESGGIESGGNLGTVKIGRDLLGGSIGTGVATLSNSGFIRADGRIISVDVGGSIFSGIDNSTSGSLVNNASIRATYEIGALTVKGDIAGNHTGADLSPVIIAARGQAAGLVPILGDLALVKITVGHRVENALFLAGFNRLLTPVDADAQVGTVTVGGDWIASSIAAGTINLGTNNTAGGTGADADNISFGDSHDVKISGAGVTDNPSLTSKIGSVVIKGHMFGAVAAEGRHFGFAAEEIGALKIATHDFSTNAANEPALTAGPSNNYFDIGGPKRTSVHELASPLLLQNADSPALLLADKRTVTYTDRDGDMVTVKISLPIFTTANVNNVLKFDNVTVGSGASAHSQLQEIDLTQFNVPAAGVSVTVTAKRGLGDGLADVGYIKAVNFDIGNISISGDLGRLDADKVGSVKVRTLGRLGLESVGSYAPNLIGQITSSLGSLSVAADVKDAGFLVASMGADTTTGAVTVGGSVVGGQIYVLGPLGTVKIGGSLMGGRASYSGSVLATTAGFKSVTIGGSVLGGIAELSGEILAQEKGGAVKIAGNLVGGLANDSGEINGGTVLGSLTVGGSLLGSGFTHAGAIAGGSDNGAVRIGHNLVGSTGIGAGSVAGNSFKGVTISGSVIGGTLGIFAGFATGAIKVGHDVLGGSNNGGTIRGDSVGNVTIGGSLVGGTGFASGAIIASKTMGTVKIGHDVAGNANSTTGYIGTTNNFSIKSVTIAGSLLGGAGTYSGAIQAHGDLGAVKIGHDLIGGSIDGSAASVTFSGSIVGDGGISSVTAGGSFITGLDRSTNGSLLGNAAVAANGAIGSVKVTGGLFGRATASGSTPVLISAVGPLSNGPTATKAIGSISVGGSVSLANLEAGFSNGFAATSGSAQIGAIQVGGNWLNSNVIAGAQNYGADHVQGGGDDNINFGNNDDHVIASEPFSKIASIVIRGTVAGSVGGTDHFGFVSHSIGSVKMAGYTAPLHATTFEELIQLSPSTGDVAIHEV